ncbi:MAG: response regulator [Planctomycetota bacterium]
MTPSTAGDATADPTSHLADLELPERILVVEDDPGIRKLLQSTFRSVPEVIEAENGHQALSILQDRKPAFMVTDLNMPGMGGLELLRRARSCLAGASIPILVLTAGGEERILLEAFHSGADDFMKKPFSMSELRTRVSAIHVRQRRARDVNPLTQLPGNTAIKREIELRLRSVDDFAVAYFDLDHFKEFNDTQGFDRGDEAIFVIGELLSRYSRSLPPGESFVGHVGGDDFVMILPDAHIQDMADFVHKGFETAVAGMYTAEELARGAIRTVNRKGEDEDVPLLSVSIGVVVTSRQGMRDLRKIAHVAAEVKKVAKGIPGNSLFVDRRKYDPSQAKGADHGLTEGGDH